MGQSPPSAEWAEPLGLQPAAPEDSSPGPGADPGAIQRRALQGLLSLTGRDAAGKLLGFGGGIVLARLLEPAAFGLFAVGIFVTSVLALISETGLGAAFTRSPREGSPRQLNAVFTFTLALTSLVTLGLFFGAPLIARWYRAPELTWLLRGLIVVFVLRSFRLVPLIIAEQRLDYGRLAVAEFAGHVGYWVVAVGAALAGLGVWSLAHGAMALAAAGVVVLYARTAWRPRFELHWGPIRTHLRFGVMYKGQVAAALAKDTLFPALGGFAYGSVAVVYLTWAQQIALIPFSLTQVVCRVSYPALARLQHDRAAFVETLEAALTWTYRVTLPALAVLVGLAPEIIRLVYGPKWLSALPVVYLLSASTVLGIGVSVLMTALYSLGRAGLALRLNLGWVTATWLAALGLVAAGAGFVALALAATIGTGLALAVIIATIGALSGTAIWRATRRSVVSGVVVAAALHIAAPTLVRGLVSLGAVAAAGAAAALAMNIWEERSVALRSIRRLWTRPPPLGRIIQRTVKRCHDAGG